MNQLISSSDVFWESLGQAILHSFWQGLVFLALTALGLKAIKSDQPGLRYWLAAGSIIAFLCSFVITFLYFLSVSDPSSTVIIFESPQAMIQAFGGFSLSPQEWKLSDLVQPSTIVYLWLIGFTIFSLRLMISYGYVHYLGKDSVLDNDSEVYRMLQKLKNKMKISGNIELRWSKKVDTIFTYGYFKPVIIWPLALINTLNPEEVEVILAHELAHIRRNDYLVKFLIGLANTILYYHPVIWWLNKVVNIEREYACDLQALSTTGDRTLLASALVKLQENKLQLAQLTANGFSDKNSFSNRIKRIFNMPIKQSLGRGKLTILLLFVGLGMFAYGYKDKLQQIKKEDIKESVAQLLPEFITKTEAEPVKQIIASQDTIKPGSSGSSSAVIIKNDGVKSIKMEMENGEIKSLEVDGKEVEKDEYDKYSKDIITLRRDAVGRGGRGITIFGDDNSPMMMELNGLKIMGDSLNFWNGLGMPHLKMNDIMKDLNLLMIDGDSSFAYNFNFNNDKWAKENQKFFEAHGKNLSKQQEHSKKFNEEFQKHWEENAHKFADQEHIWKEHAKEWEEAAKELAKEGEKYGMEMQRFAEIPRIEGFNYGRSGSNLEQKIGTQLNSDGFLLEGKENAVKLSGKYLRINGDKMPEVIFEKYKNLFEEETGIPLSKDTVIEFKMMGDNSGNRKYRAF